MISNASPATPTRQSIDTDIIILGGGIAGLWTLNRLSNLGYQCLLFEANALGHGQTVASQGMIHGGVKYALGGALTGASEAIAEMPDLWRQCLAGNGPVDLQGVEILSDHFYMWSTKSLGSRLSTFLASKALRGRTDAVSKEDRPALFDTPAFKGNLYRLRDIVLDVPNVIAKLRDNYSDRIFKIDWDQATLERASDGSIAALQIQSSASHYRIAAQRYLLTAGEGNEALLQQLGSSGPVMQRRPLQQVIIKHRIDKPIYAHCIGASAEATPRLTISSHPAGDGEWVWYLGGDLASSGVDKDPEQLIATAQQEMASLMPWLDLSAARWGCLRINRAEPRQRNFARPDKAFAGPVNGVANALVGWPTKLTLSPNLADEMIALLQSAGITPSAATTTEPLALPQPDVAAPFWHGVV